MKQISLKLIILFACFFSCKAIDMKNLEVKEISSGWQFKQVNGDKAGKATVPGTIHTDLLTNGLIEDPFYRINEKKQQWIDKLDWEYFTSFQVSDSEFTKQNNELYFKGLDTYADVFLNGKLILQADNMFREWKVDVKPFLLKGKNDIRILFHSPINKGLKMLEASPYPHAAANDQSENGELGDKKVSIFTRKAGYHYGWDWGPRFVTSGIWRPIFLQSWNNACIVDVFIKQPSVDAKLAKLNAFVTFQSNEYEKVEVLVFEEKSGKQVASQSINARKGENQVGLPFEITNPNLWWSNGLGKANLYQFRIVLKIKNKEFDTKTVQTGLRSLKLVRKPDTKGETFYFELNGVPVFAKGSNYIPNDNFLPRVSENDYKKVVQDAVDANMNMLRVWGGGTYENDMFYNLCDQKGIMVWQDFMFACSTYPGDAAFLESIKFEARENIIRLRNHPSIALWCGNNEIDAAWQHDNPTGGWQWKEKYTETQRNEIYSTYLKIFHEILPQAVEKYTDGDAYWPSSPSAGPNPNQHATDNTPSGDIHYWGVWHGKHKFDQFEVNIGRFMSEYGFQSFPEFETVKKYTIPDDYSIESEVMASHQRSGIGNLRIKEYMGWDYNVPTNFEQFLYVGQILQARGIKAAIEAHRRAMPYCMGTLYWQINDCWPVASWSSTDYYHNWKALHYIVKKAYLNIIVSTFEKNGKVEFTVVSDELNAHKSQLDLKLIDFSGKVLNTKSVPFQLAANTSTLVKSFTKNELLGGNDSTSVCLHIYVKDQNATLAENVYYFVAPKDLKLEQASANIEVTEKAGLKIITLSSAKLLKDIMLYVPNYQIQFSDNYFDVLPNKKYTISVKTNLTVEQLKKQLKYRTLVSE